ncbi:MAG: ABC transporter ATP-binding protein [Actinomycetota bacterium]
MSLAVDAAVTLDGFTLEVAVDLPDDGTVAIVGPNGAGKSTLVALLAGLIPPDRGTIRLGGRTLDGDGNHVPARERNVGVAFQERRLFPTLSALENVAFPLRARGVATSPARERARAVLARVGLVDRAGALPGDLSGGEQQRVALARALVAEPDLLILDEPLAALDVRARADIRSLLARELAAFPGVRIVVSHDPVDAMTLADRVVVLEGGRVVQVGTPDEIRDAPATPWAADLVGLNRFRGRLEPLEPGAGRLVVEGGGEVIVAWPADVPHVAQPDVTALLRPSDVSLSLTAPTSGSARNMLRGRIRSIALETERARVRVDATPPIVAEITLGSVLRLRLAADTEVWVTFKAVEPRIELGAALS